MRNLLICLLFVPVHVFGQSELVGKWKIDNLIGVGEITEYTLKQPDWNEYGNNLQLFPDGSFKSYYSAECGNDLFTTCMGKYTMIDDTHIKFRLTNINRHGIGYKTENLIMDTDLGLFYISVDSASVKFIQSDGNLSVDRKNVSFSKLIDEYSADRSRYNVTTKTAKNGDWPTLVRAAFDGPAVDLSLVHFCYAKKRSVKSAKITLVEYLGNFYFLMYLPSGELHITTKK